MYIRKTGYVVGNESVLTYDSPYKVFKTGYVVLEKENIPTAVIKSLSISDIKNQGYTHYEILSSENSCQICQEHDGVIVPVEDAQESINLPPFHSNCKCTIVGYLLNIHDARG